MARLFKILAIDGGGIRGVIPATVLMEIEKQTGKRIAELFDLIAGTSTGGILAVGLAKPGAEPGKDGRAQYTAADMRELYLREGAAIFPKPAFPQSLWSNATRPFAEKYASQGIESVLQKYFGDSRLKDSLCNLLVTSYEIQLRQPWFFRSDRARQDAEYDFLLWEVARATSAAPTYFAPARIPRGGDPQLNSPRSGADQPSSPRSGDPQPDSWMLIDGGVYANNPALCAYAGTRQIDPDTEVLLVSLGTGRHAQAIHYRPGLLGWAKPILDVVFDGVSRTTEYQLEQLLLPVRGAKRYYRFQVNLTDAEDELDDADPSNLRRLTDHADGLIQEEMAQLREVCAQLAL
jgi:patatin-like phospholipase/acyl hydrolase